MYYYNFPKYERGNCVLKLPCRQLKKNNKFFLKNFIGIEINDFLKKCTQLPQFTLYSFCSDFPDSTFEAEESTTDDFLIAQLLQKQFDKEFDENLHVVSLKSV